VTVYGAVGISMTKSLQDFIFPGPVHTFMPTGQQSKKQSLIMSMNIKDEHNHWT